MTLPARGGGVTFRSSPAKPNREPYVIRDILIWPDARLKQKSKPVARVDDRLRALVADMFETMYEAEGVGLAAPQVGVLSRLIVVDTSPKDEGEAPFALINPVILEKKGEVTYSEGCLSIPGESEDVDRAAEILVRYTNVDGEVVEKWCAGLCAICVQHELDHLDGIVFVDHISVLKRELIRKRMKKLQREQEEEREAEAEGQRS